MAFSLMVADKMGAVEDDEKGESVSMECTPSPVADHVRSPEKDASDFWNQSIQSSRQRPPPRLHH
jgi:hypothetical protein